MMLRVSVLVVSDGNDCLCIFYGKIISNELKRKRMAGLRKGRKKKLGKGGGGGGGRGRVYRDVGVDDMSADHHTCHE